jgi:hypothetical protein
VSRSSSDNDDPVGEIRIASVPFEVVGVLAEKGPSGADHGADDEEAERAERLLAGEFPDRAARPGRPFRGRCL